MKQITLLLAALLTAAAAGCGGKTAVTADDPRPSGYAPDSTAQCGPAPVKADSMTFAFVGDIMMGTTFPDSVAGSHLPANNGKNLFDGCREIFNRVDIAAGNLEGSFLEGPGERRPVTNPNTYYIFRMPPEYVDNLVEAGFDFVGIANNHINDFGEPGRASTMATLRGASLGHAGLKGRCETALYQRNGLRVGITQFGHGDNNLDVNDLDELRRVVKSLRDSADIVVVSFHGGAEGVKFTHVPHQAETYVGEARGNVEQFARAAVDAGADIVFGHGPHVPRAAELYNDHIIFYSLGNFCTPFRMSIGGITGYAPVAEVTVGSDGKFRRGRIHSFVQRRGSGPVADESNAAARLIKKLSAEDFPASPLKIDDNGNLHR